MIVAALASASSDTLKSAQKARNAPATARERRVRGVMMPGERFQRCTALYSHPKVTETLQELTWRSHL